MSTDDAIDRMQGVPSESDPRRISELTGQSLEWVDRMLIDRRGDQPGTNMTAVGLHQLVGKSGFYRVSSEHGLQPTSVEFGAIDLEAAVAEASSDDAPPCTTVHAVWGTPDASSADAQNLLGDSVRFVVSDDESEIALPLVEATTRTMGYYGAILIADGAIVRFPGADYPIWKMELGRGYVDGFLMADGGTGFYLEYHRDRPHWHQPLSTDAGGFYVLARPAPAGSGRYHLTAFRIPFGTSVYTGLGTMHCDAALTGTSWLVGFCDSMDYSTAVIRNRSGKAVRITTERPHER